MADVEAAEQPVPIVLLVLLVLMNPGEGLCRLLLPLSMLLKGIIDLLLAFFDGGEPGVKVLMVHWWFLMESVWTMEACCVVVEASCREGHASSLGTTIDLLIILLLVEVKVTFAPPCTEFLLLGRLRVMGSRLLPSIMPWVVYLRWSCLIKPGVVGEGRSCCSGVFTMIPRIWVSCESGGGTPVGFRSFFLQIKNKRIHHIQTEILVWQFEFICIVFGHHYCFTIFALLKHMHLVKIYIVNDPSWCSDIHNYDIN